MAVLAVAAGATERVGAMGAPAVEEEFTTAVAGATGADIMEVAGVIPAMGPDWLGQLLAAQSWELPSPIRTVVINITPDMTHGAILLVTRQALEPATETGQGDIK